MQTFNEENRKSSPAKWNKKINLKNINTEFKIIKHNIYKDEKNEITPFTIIAKFKKKKIVVLFAICATKL